MVARTEFLEINFDVLPDSKKAKTYLEDLSKEKPVNDPRRVNKSIVLYGAGDLGRLATEYLKRLGIKPLFVIDKNPEIHQNDKFWSGIDIVTPEEVEGRYKKSTMIAICIATLPLNPIAAYLRKSGWVDVVPFYDIAEAYRDRIPLSNGWFTGSLTEEDIENIGNVLELWDDDISRAHHLQFIAWHYCRTEWIFNNAPVLKNSRYFIPEVTSLLHDSETFMDIGAHYGDVSRKFAQVVGNKMNGIYIIEPDDDNLFKLIQGLSNLPMAIVSRIKILNAAVGENAGKGLFFKGLGYASQLTNLGDHEVEIKTIDDLRIAPTFIKLHLEGSELNVLKGACDTIQRSRPIIASTSYHNRLGLWEFPLWLMENLKDYRFLMRLHSWCGTGAVIYCLPRDRSNTTKGDC